MINQDPIVLWSKQALQGGQAGLQYSAKQSQPCTGWCFTAVPDLLGAGSRDVGSDSLPLWEHGYKRTDC